MSEEIKDMIEPIPNWEFTYRYDGSRTCGKSYIQSLLGEKDKQIEDLQQKVEQLEKENFNIRENIHLERISLPPELTKDKNFMELYDIPSYEDLQQKVEQLEKENIKQKEIIENLTTMTVCGDKKQIKNTAQYKLEQLESIRKEAIEYINHATIGADSSPIEDSWLYNLYETRHILSKGDNNE